MKQDAKLLETYENTYQSDLAGIDHLKDVLEQERGTKRQKRQRM